MSGRPRLAGAVAGAVAGLIAALATPLNASVPEVNPVGTDPEPIVLAAEPEGEAPEPVHVSRFGRDIHWLGDLTPEELAEVVTIEFGDVSARLTARINEDGQVVRSRRLHAVLRASSTVEAGQARLERPRPGVIETARTNHGQAYGPANFRWRYSSGPLSPDGPQSMGVRFPHPPTETRWLEDVQGRYRIRAHSDRQARVTLRNIDELIGRTVQVEGVDNSRMHLTHEGRSARGDRLLFIYMDRGQADRLIEIRAFVDGEQIDNRIEHHGSYMGGYPGRRLDLRYHVQQEDGSRRYKHAPPEQIDRIEIVMHPDFAILELPFTIDRMPLPHRDDIVGPEAPDRVVAPSSDREPAAAPPLRGDVEIIIEDE